jgi:hypothetical protein
MKTRKYLFTIVGGSILINPAFAQDQAADEVPEVIVTGLRASSNRRRPSSSTPTRSSTRSLRPTSAPSRTSRWRRRCKRVPGITVSRLQSSDDSNHFSAEPATVLIRGLTFVRTEFNGRDSFSADGYRGLNFNDVSPELMQGVDTYKNQTAEMIEGGISGVVNLRTRMPFDSDGQAIALTGRANYGDMSEEPTYEFSGVYSNNWDTDTGRFGVLLNAAYSNILTRTEAVNMTRISSSALTIRRAVVPIRPRCSMRTATCSATPILRRHGLGLCTGPGELLAGGLRPHAHRCGAHAAIRE